MEYGCIGEHLLHSFSKVIHNKIASYKYELCEIAPDKLDSFMKEALFSGINVTIPYKEKVIPFLDHISRQAQEIGSVNTIYKKQGKLYGCNTDYFGLDHLFKHAGCDPCGKKVAILGSGGASKMAEVLMRDRNAREILVVSRTPLRSHISYEALLSQHKDVELVINTTPVGMYPHNDGSPLCIDSLDHLEGVIDLVYNPLRTNLVLDALKRGIPADGGLYMLVAQAVSAAEYFRNTTYPSSMIDDIYNDLLYDKENMVLLGSSFKSAFQVAEKLRELSARDIFHAEASILSEVAKHTHAIIVVNTDEKLSANALSVLLSNGIIYATEAALDIIPYSSTGSFVKNPQDNSLIKVIDSETKSDETAQRIFEMHYTSCTSTGK